ncbi:hypothetical protein OAK85_04900, partial [Mariniblastus sp.]|nr:hypothetical protein [Mariniblastus sp.]
KLVDPDPWDLLLDAHRNFLTNLECAQEMFELVSPILKLEDEKRQGRIDEIAEEIDRDGKTAFKLQSIDDVREFISHSSRLKTADRMFRQNMIVSIVSRFDEFVMVLLRRCFELNHSWLKNPEKSVTYVQLLELDSIESFVDDLILKEVDQLMRGSHHAQIEILDSKLKLGIEQHFKRWSAFLEITERRNLFVHSAGIVNSIYVANAEKYGYDIPKQEVLTADDSYVAEAIDIFFELSVRLVQSVVRRLYPDCLIEADWNLNNLGVSLLTETRWDLSLRIFDFAIGIPEKLKSKDEVSYYNVINACIALKFSGKPFSKKLQSVNWKPLHPKYHFAIAILEERFDDAAKLMKSDAVRTQIDERSLINWPLLRDFRKTEQFQAAFEEMFGRKYEAGLLEKTKEEIKTERQEYEPEISDAQLKELYPYDYNSLTTEMAERYSDFKANQLYHAIRKPLLADAKFAVRRFLDPGNPRSQTKDYYSPSVFDVFDVHYSKCGE